MFSISASKNHTPLSFKAQVNSVRYVIVDGLVTDNKSVIEDVSRQFASRLRKGNILEQPLCKSLLSIIPEYGCDSGSQPAKFLRIHKMGREFNIIVGHAAGNLKRIWGQAGVALETKKQQAGNAVREIIHKMPYQQIAIDAITQNIKGKVKYIIKNIYRTV